MIISNDNDSLIFDMHIMMKMIPRYYHSIITQISIKYPNIKSQTNNILSRYFDKPQYCTLVEDHLIYDFIYHFIIDSFLTGPLGPTNDQLLTSVAS